MNPAPQNPVRAYASVYVQGAALAPEVAKPHVKQSAALGQER